MLSDTKSSIIITSGCIPVLLLSTAETNIEGSFIPSLVRCFRSTLSSVQPPAAFLSGSNTYSPLSFTAIILNTSLFSIWSLIADTYSLAFASVAQSSIILKLGLCHKSHIGRAVEATVLLKQPLGTISNILLLSGNSLTAGVI